MSRRRRKRRRNPGSRTGRLSTILSILGIMLVGVFLVSRVVTDRYAWSQWLWWTPAGWFVLVGLGMLAGSVAAGWMSRRRGGKKRGLLLRGVLLVGCVGMMLNLVFGVRRYQNMLGGHGIHWTRAVDDDRVRVMHWNLSASQIDVNQTINWIGESNIDIALIANPRWDGQREQLMTALHSVYGELGTVRRLPRAVVASRFDLVEISTVYVSASGNKNDNDNAMRPTGDFGWVAMLRFDRGEEHGGAFDVWLVDLPSEPSVHRMESMERVAELLQEQNSGARPALIIGDFNTVRGSASLGVFDEFESGNGFVDAFKARGSLGGSWKPSGIHGVRGWIMGRSNWHIDLSLVGNGWRTDGYELVIPDGSAWGTGGVSHKAQVVDIER